jgi:hypothetical protein
MDIKAREGDTVVVSAETRHMFCNTSSGRLQLAITHAHLECLCIPLASTMLDGDACGASEASVEAGTHICHSNEKVIV